MSWLEFKKSWLESEVDSNYTSASPSSTVDIISSLKYIHELSDNSFITIWDLSLKTAFLLALVTALVTADLPNRSYYN